MPSATSTALAQTYMAQIRKNVREAHRAGLTLNIGPADPACQCWHTWRFKPQGVRSPPHPSQPFPGTLTIS